MLTLLHDVNRFLQESCILHALRRHMHALHLSYLSSVYVVTSFLCMCLFDVELLIGLIETVVVCMWARMGFVSLL